MARVLIGIIVLLSVAGLMVVHFSLAQADHGGDPSEHTPVPTVPPPSASMSITSGQGGMTVQVNGSNFTQSSISITFAGETVRSNVSVNSGSFSTSFQVPHRPAGRYAVVAGGVFVDDFNIVATFNISPSSGAPGTSVNILGRGFNPNSTINLTIGGAPWESVNTDSDGEISRSLQVPQTSGGPKTIQAGGANASFNVTPTVSVDQGNVAPGSSMTVRGAGFRSGETGISISIGSSNVRSGIRADNQGRWEETVTVPSLTAGSHNVSAQGQDSATASITVGAGVGVEPTRGSPGTVVRLRGSGVRASERVTINIGNGLFTEDVSADNNGVWTRELTIPDAPRGNLLIRASASGETVETSFDVVPSISLSESLGFPGGSISITGRGFTANQGGLSITFDGQNVASASADAQGSWEVDLTIPPAPRDNYTIQVAGVTPVLQESFTVGAGVSLSNPNAGPGETVTINGGGFTPNESGIEVRLGNDTIARSIAADSNGSWSRTFEIPALPAGSYPLTASGPSTSSGSVEGQTLNVGTHLTLNSTSGTPGDTITVQGRGFDANEAGISIDYGGAVVASGLTADGRGAFVTTFVVPPSPAGRHTIRVSGAMGGGADIAFQNSPGLTLSSSSGAPGMNMQLRGHGFGANEQNIEIRYAGETVLSDVAADVNGSFEVSFLVPPTPAGERIIEGRGPTSSSAAQPQRRFTVVPGITLNQPEGHVGMEVSAAGRGFNPSSTVTLTFDDLTQATVTADPRGSFNTNFAIPQAPGGERSVRALDEAGNQAEFAFVMDSAPPAAPQLRAPDNDSSGGIFGGFRPQQRWQPVEDPSGVTYTVQVATDPDFVDVILERPGLTSPNYELAEDEALDRGKYYWRVKAVDRASNESPYSDAFAVNSGIVPIWVVPAALALGLLASGGGFYAYYTRNRRRKQAQETAGAFPEFVRISRPEIAAPSQGQATGGAAAPPAALSAPPRRALPSPFRRGGGKTPSLSPEEQARLQMVVDFVRSIPLTEVTPDLTWLEELVESLGGTSDVIYEEVLRGDIEPVYQPAWMQHPTYQDLQSLESARGFLVSLEEYVELVNDCAAETLTLLRRIYVDLETSGTLDAMGDRHWRFVSTVGLSSLAWFRGTYLGQPSAREYIIKPASDRENEPLASLYAVESSPFSGPPLLENLDPEDLEFYRDLHVQLRNTYRTSDDFRALAARMTAAGTMRDQLMQGIAQLGDQIAK